MAKVIVKAKKPPEPKPKAKAKPIKRAKRDTPSNLTREEQRRLNWEHAHGNPDRN